jgi:hypothetical protein
MLPKLRIGLPGPAEQDNSNNMQQLQGTIIIQTNCIHISMLNNFIFFSKVLGFSFYVVD